METRAVRNCVLVVLLFLLLGAGTAAGNLEGFEQMAESESLRLYLNPDTTEVAIQEKGSSLIWYSNPQNLRMERIKRGRARDALKGLITLNYYTPTRQPKSLNSYVDSVENGEFSVTPVEDGVRIDYVLGKLWSDEAYLPIMISKDRMEEVLSKVEDEFDRELLLEDYTLITLRETETDPYAGVHVYGVDLQKVFGNWDIVALSGGALSSFSGRRNSPEERKQRILEGLSDTFVNVRKDMERRGHLTSNDIEPLKNTETYVLIEGLYPSYDLADLIRIFREAGYRPEDVIEDHTTYNLDPPIPNPEVFRIPIVFQLDGSNLVVTIPADEIGYPQNVVTEEGDIATFYPHSIDLLPYFGAADSRAKGYMFVPDGPGGLIQLNNAKKIHLPPYFGYVYGEDRSVAPKAENISQPPKIRMPVYGLKDGEQAFLAMIEEGRSLAYVRADLSGQSNSFNNVYAGFVITPRATITLYGVNEDQDNRAVDVYQARPYQGNIKLRLAFLAGDQADYPGMAKYYREYLKARYGWEKLQPEDSLPFYLELIGGINRRTVVLGAPREIVEPLTDFDQAQTIIRELKRAGIENIKLRYNGWSERGVKHSFPTRATPEETLGGETGFLSLIGAMNQAGVSIYPDIDFLSVYQDTVWDSFGPGKDAARFMNRDAVRIHDFDLATFLPRQETGRYVLSARRLPSVVDQFLASLQRFPVAGISLRHMGEGVYSDFRETPDELIDREQAAAILSEQLEKIASRGLDVMINGGNDLVLPYASHILNAPTEGSKLDIIDEVVPFYQMVLHGYINYAGSPLNRCGSLEDKVLQALETGQVPYYRLSYADSSVIKDTEFESLLSINYRDWKSEAVSLYKQVNPILNRVQDKEIVDHRKLGPGVYQTTYEGGAVIIVNYNETAVEVEGEKIDGKGYLVFERGK